MTRLLFHLIGLALVQGVFAQTVFFEPMARIQLRAHEPASYGPCGVIRVVDVPVNYAFSLRFSRTYGKRDYPSDGYTLLDMVTRWGAAAERYLLRREKVGVGLGIAFEQMRIERAVSGYYLSWGRSFTGSGFNASIIVRSELRLGQVLSAFLSVEPGYTHYSSKSFLPDMASGGSLTGLPLSSGFHFTGGCGLSLILRAEK